MLYFLKCIFYATRTLSKRHWKTSRSMLKLGELGVRQTNLAQPNKKRNYLLQAEQDSRGPEKMWATQVQSNLSAICLRKTVCVWKLVYSMPVLVWVSTVGRTILHPSLRDCDVLIIVENDRWTTTLLCNNCFMVVWTANTKSTFLALFLGLFFALFRNCL